MLAEIAVVIELGEQRAGARDVAGIGVVVEPDVAPGQVLAVEVAGPWIDDVGAFAGLDIENVLISAVEKVATAPGQLFLQQVVRRKAEITP